MAMVASFASGIFCRMATTTRIKEYRERAKLSQEQLADAVGLSVSQISRFESGEREPRINEMISIGAKLNVPVGVLICEDEQPKPVLVIGRISAGGAIDTSTEQRVEGEEQSFIHVPDLLVDDPIAYEVVGDSMLPRYEAGDVVVVSERGVDPFEAIGHEAAVATPDGARYLKMVDEGSRPRLFDLRSHNAPTIRNVRLEWASSVVHVIRAPHVRRTTRSAKRQRVTQAPTTSR